jgi:hypothetical protein
MEKEDLDEDFFPDEDFRVVFFDVPPFCESANFFILEVLDFFATSVMVKGYWLRVYRLLKKGKDRDEISRNKNTIFNKNGR